MRELGLLDFELRDQGGLAGFELSTRIGELLLRLLDLSRKLERILLARTDQIDQVCHQQQIRLEKTENERQQTNTNKN